VGCILDVMCALMMSGGTLLFGLAPSASRSVKALYKDSMVGGASHLNLVSRRVKIPLEIDFFSFRINGRVCYLH
jgi:hypothetical protein